MFKTIVWATDGSEHADRALDVAKTLASEQGATLTIVHVVQRIAATIAVAHPKNLLNATPQVGDIVRIEYVNGHATVETAAP